MNRKWLLIGISTLVLIGAVAAVLFILRPFEKEEISSFDECVAAGYPIQETYPRQCTDDESRVHVEVIPEDQLPDGDGNDESLCADNCGNGICEEVVCMGEDCPCAETAESCPQDCRSDSEAEIANPASVFCEDNGGKLEIRDDAEGGQVGYCIFPDGYECEEWAFYHGECPPDGE